MRCVLCLLMLLGASAAATDHRFGVKVGFGPTGTNEASIGSLDTDLEVDTAGTLELFYEYHGAERGPKVDTGWLFHLGIGLTRHTFKNNVQKKWIMSSLTSVSSWR